MGGLPPRRLCEGTDQTDGRPAHGSLSRALPESREMPQEQAAEPIPAQTMDKATKRERPAESGLS